ncbi:polysaccharide deacetylase family protein [Neobacillus endophyticus]|uniref:polysaccharide deacetylase family protein n=1 Tax=Neobacillus endophyticus TaxID=2738405 RepID=UPI001C27678F|nr:polysaccharide deacetylase family protein [Neobacillus endophyticus]
MKKSENTFTKDSAVIDLESFEEQMKYLHDEGYHTATISELDAYLHGGKELPQKTVMITFDDGLKTNYLYAYPILKKYGFKAVNFIITSRVSDTPVPFNPKKLQFLSWPEINEMRDVFEYGNHTNELHGTVDGTPALLKESDQVILQDLETSGKLLNHPDYFAYPFGAYNSRTIELLKMAGFKYAFTTKAETVKIGDNPYELGRFPITPNITLNEFKTLVAK